MSKVLYSFCNNLLNLLPPFGYALDLRGKWARYFLKVCGERLRISSNVNIYDPMRVTIGNHVYIGYNTYIGGGDVTLDDQVIIGPFCSIVAGNHTMKDGSYRYGPYDYGTISVGRGTWLGSHVTILSNVKIGKGCLIAAGSVVTKDVEDFSIVGGVPAKLIKKIETTT
jgi:maltose O-acetyltransferase